MAAMSAATAMIATTIAATIATAAVTMMQTANSCRSISHDDSCDGDSNINNGSVSCNDLSHGFDYSSCVGSYHGSSNCQIGCSNSNDDDSNSDVAVNGQWFAFMVTIAMELIGAKTAVATAMRLYVPDGIHLWRQQWQR